MPSISIKVTGPPTAKQTHNINNLPPYFTVGLDAFPYMQFSFLCQTCTWCAMPKCQIFILSDHKYTFVIVVLTGSGLFSGTTFVCVCVIIPSSLLWTWLILILKIDNLKYQLCNFLCLPTILLYCGHGYFFPQDFKFYPFWTLRSFPYALMYDCATVCRSTSICVDRSLVYHMVMDDMKFQMYEQQHYYSRSKIGHGQQ